MIGHDGTVPYAMEGYAQGSRAVGSDAAQWCVFVSAEGTKKGALNCHYCCKGVQIFHWSENYNGPDVAAVDHVVPLSRGGADHASNMVVACRPCNMRKGSS